MTDPRGLTPSQTVGPYFTIGLQQEASSADLVAAKDLQSITIRGKLLDGNGDPVPDGMVEIWCADSQGRYGSGADGSAGFGRSITAPDGSFAFTTIKPGRVATPAGELQAPHLAVGVFARGLLKRLVTRLYFPDEEKANAEDPVLSSVTPARRTTLIAVAEPDGLRFDIRLQGAGETAFFAV